MVKVTVTGDDCFEVQAVLTGIELGLDRIVGITVIKRQPSQIYQRGDDLDIDTYTPFEVELVEGV